MQEKAIRVFVEVRFRNNVRFGHPLETINAKKISCIRKTALHYLKKSRPHSFQKRQAFYQLGVSLHYRYQRIKSKHSFPLQSNSILYDESHIRFDVISITPHDGIHWIQNAFDMLD